MDLEKFKSNFAEKYEQTLGMSFRDWYATAPDNEGEAYRQLQLIDKELEETYDEWFNAQGEHREQLEDYRHRLKLEIELIEELFGLNLDED